MEAELGEFFCQGGGDGELIKMTGLEVKSGGIEIRPKSQEALSKISGKKKIKHRTFIDIFLHSFVDKMKGAKSWKLSKGDKKGINNSKLYHISWHPIPNRKTLSRI